jgi:hypothetical protein
VAGGVLGPGGKLRKNAAAFDARTGRPLDWNPQVRGETFVNAAPIRGVYALAASSDSVYLAGPFTEINRQPRNRIGAVDATTGALLPWNPNASGIVEALAISGSVVYAGGRFSGIGDATRTNLAALDASTGSAIDSAPNPDDKVKAIVRQGSLVYVGGLFSQIGGQQEYTLVVTNALGLVNSRPATLTVIQPLSIITQPVGQTVAPGTTVTLSAAVVGHPPPIYQWRLNGVNIPGAIYPTLVISNAHPTNGGSYNVVVANLSSAVSSAVATLVVSGPALPFSDNFDPRGVINQSTGAGGGNN